MKYLVLILFAVAACTTAQEEDHATLQLSHAFMISYADANACVQKIGLTPGELWILNNKSFEDVDPKNSTVMRLVCTLTCCAQAQGTMVGSELQLPVIHNMIQTSRMPPHIKPTFHKFIDDCAELVHGLTDECEVGLVFLKCMMEKPWDEIERK